MATISLCMIGKNEEEVVKRGLNACAPYVDEIIFGDDGSTDATAEIVRQYPHAKIFSLPQPHEMHFANMKNQAIERATGDYVLFQDCDEIFEQDLLENLQRLTAYEPYIHYDAFAFARKTYIDGLLVNIDNHDYQIRFWKNHKGIHYEGKIHESPVGYDNLMFCNLWILHKKTREMQQEDNERYWDMGQQPPPGWVKENGRWTLRIQINKQS